MAQDKDGAASTRAGRDSLKLVSTQTIIAVFGIFYFALVTRVFSKVDISVLAIVTLFNSIGGSIAGLGLTTLAIQRVPSLMAAGRHTEAARMLATSIAWSVAGAIAMAGGIALASRPLSGIFFKTTDASGLIIASGLLLVTYKAFESVNVSMLALDDFRSISLMRLLNDIALRAIAFPAYLFGGIFAYMITMAIGQVLISAIMLCLKRKQIIIAGFSNLKQTLALIRESLPFYGYSFFRSATAQADSLLIGILLQPEGLATYYVIRRFFDYIIIFYDAMLTPLLPKVAAKRGASGSEVLTAFRQSSRYALPICIILPILLLPLSKQILFVYGGTKFISGLPGLILLFAAAALYGVFGLHSSFILATLRPVDALANDLIIGSVNSGLSFFLAATYGVTGGAGAKAIAMAIASISSFQILKKQIPIGLHHDWGVFKHFFPVFVAGSLAVIFAQLWTHRFPGVCLVWTGILMITCTWVVRVSNSNDLNFLLSSLHLDRCTLVRRVVKFIRPAA